MPARLGVVLLSLVVATPALAGGPHGKVEGAGAPRFLHATGRTTPVWVLAPGAAATLILHGPATVTVTLRAAGRHLARVRALVSDHHRHRRLETPARRDATASVKGLDAVGAAARTTVRLGRGRQWITVAWPHHARADGIVAFSGVDLGIAAPRPKAVAAKATPRVPLATLTPPKPAAAAAPRAKPAPKATPTVPLARLTPKKPAPPPKGYERIRAYGDRTDAPPPPPTEAERTSGPARTFTLTPWVGAYVPLYKLSVGPAAGLTFALDLKALGLDLGATRLGLRLDLGWTRVIASGPAIVPGRGFDVGFTQDSHLVPASLALAWHLAPAASVRPFILAGLGTVWTQTHFTAFSAPVSDRAFGLLGVFGAGLGFQAGPGELGLEVLVDVAGVDLGPLGPVGETTLSGVRADARYALRF